MNGYIEEESLYRVYRKKDSHISKKINTDGTVAGIQFTDEENALDGPILIKPVDKREVTNSVPVDNENEVRSFKQIIFEEVIAPNLQYAIERALDIGFEHLNIWMDEVAIPKAKQKTKNFVKDAKIIMSGVKDGLAGKETKASRLLREIENEKNAAIDVVEPSVECSVEDVELRSPEEVKAIIDAMKNSALIIAAGIRLLSNTVVADDGSNPETQIEMQRNLGELTSENIMNSINLILEDKNKDLLDQASMRMLAAFREGNFIINGEIVPISNYLSMK